MSQLFISTDIEANGPIPGCNSMLSFGSVALEADGTEVGSFSANLLPLKHAHADAGTMAWWAKQPEAWAAVNVDRRSPEEVMPAYFGWLKSFVKRDLVFVGYPATYDFMFVYWYLMRFVGESPFSFSAWDVKTAAAIALGVDFRKVTKRNMPAGWFAGAGKHTHIAVEDAREQGKLHLSILRRLGYSP